MRKSIKVYACCGMMCLSLINRVLADSASLPQNPSVISGSASFAQSGSTLNVNTTTSKSVLNWGSFNIGSSNGVNFNQPDAASISLNRVTGGSPSSIYGSLNSNGRVFLVNPNGILFGPSSHVDTAGLLASTLDISTSDFLNGQYNFAQNGPAAGLINQGQITSNGGYVALLSNAIKNTGTVQAPLGRVALATGEKMTVPLDNGAGISVVVSDAVKNSITGLDGIAMRDSIDNKGSIVADGGTINLTANVLNTVFDHAINTSGIVQANVLTTHNGNVQLMAQGAGTLATGQINATGGNVSISSAQDVTVNNPLSTHGDLTVNADRDVNITSSLQGDGRMIVKAGRDIHAHNISTTHMPADLLNVENMELNSGGNITFDHIADNGHSGFIKLSSAGSISNESSLSFIDTLALELNAMTGIGSPLSPVHSSAASLHDSNVRGGFYLISDNTSIPAEIGYHPFQLQDVSFKGVFNLSASGSIEAANIKSLDDAIGNHLMLTALPRQTDWGVDNVVFRNLNAGANYGTIDLNAPDGSVGAQMTEIYVPIETLVGQGGYINFPPPQYYPAPMTANTVNISSLKGVSSPETHAHYLTIIMPLTGDQNFFQAHIGNDSDSLTLNTNVGVLNVENTGHIVAQNVLAKYNVSLTSDTGNITVNNIDTGRSLSGPPRYVSDPPLHQVTLTAQKGAVIANGVSSNITTNVLAMTTSQGIGQNQPLNTHVDNLTASAFDAGPININELDSLTIDKARAVNGTIDITTGGDLLAKSVEVVSNWYGINLTSKQGLLKVGSIYAGQKSPFNNPIVINAPNGSIESLDSPSLIGSHVTLNAATEIGKGLAPIVITSPATLGIFGTLIDAKLTSAGDINIAATGNINLNSLSTPSGTVSLTDSGGTISGSSSVPNITATNAKILAYTGTIGTANPVNVLTTTLSVGAAGIVNTYSVKLAGKVNGSSVTGPLVIALPGGAKPPGIVIFNRAQIWPIVADQTSAWAAQLRALFQSRFKNFNFTWSVPPTRQPQG